MQIKPGISNIVKAAMRGMATIGLATVFFVGATPPSVSAAPPAATITATCSGPSTMTGYYSGGKRYTNQVKVSCTGTVSRIRVWGELRIKGVVKATADVTCWSASTCTMPEMSAVAGQNDSWTSQYWFNWTN